MYGPYHFAAIFYSTGNTYTANITEGKRHRYDNSIFEMRMGILKCVTEDKDITKDVIDNDNTYHYSLQLRVYYKN